MRAAVDVMGGDHAPRAILQGCWDAAPLLEKNDSVLLVGDAQICTDALAASDLPADKKSLYRVVAAADVIGMDESPVEAVRAKPNSSIAVMCKLAAAGEADVVISAGNTGACVAAAQLRMRTLPGIQRPGIAVVIPTFHGPVVLCDVGANPLPKPLHMKQYAIMAAAFSTAVCGIENPRVGLLSIGEEESKGTIAVKQTRHIMVDDPIINFYGNVEGRDLFKGVVDVVICDGFVGNVLLKFFEGTVEGLFRELLASLQEMTPDLVDRISPVMKKVQTELDWRDYGGAPLLGVAGLCLICHGRSDARAIKNAIRVGKQLCGNGINEKIVAKIKASKQVEE
ncbi:MAG: phosphate acyltransferase PlsX [Tepidisphaeraceae bacterium]